MPVYLYGQLNTARQFRLLFVQPPAQIASLIGLSAVIVAGDAPIEEDTLKKAEQNDVLILATSLPAYDVIGKLYELGIRNVK